MYLGRGSTKIISNLPHSLTKRADVSLSYKEIVSKYTDVNNIPREDLIGYVLSFEFIYIFKNTEELEQTMLRTLINDRIVTVTPRLDQMEINYECTLSITKDEQKDMYDRIEVTAKVIETVEEIPFRPFEVVISPDGYEFPSGGSVNVSMSCATQGAKIYYTIDGNTPTDKSTEYIFAIIVDSTTTVKAIAVVGDFATDVTIEVYTEGAPT